MITIPFALLLTAFAYFKGNVVRKHNVIFYIGAIILATITFLLRYKVKITEPFTQGYLGLAFLYIVMMTGALKKKSTLYKKLMGVRREYSIIGFIFVSFHGLKYLIEFLQNARHFEWLGVIPYVIMLPLFITSFMVVRRKFTFTTWKKIQQFAYIAYILIFVHLIIVASNVQNFIVYFVLFVPYIVLKLHKEFKLRKKA